MALLSPTRRESSWVMRGENVLDKRDILACRKRPVATSKVGSWLRVDLLELLRAVGPIWRREILGADDRSVGLLAVDGVVGLRRHRGVGLRIEEDRLRRTERLNHAEIRRVREVDHAHVGLNLGSGR